MFDTKSWQIQFPRVLPSSKGYLKEYIDPNK